jgi:hypothetical protein
MIFHRENKSEFYLLSGLPDQASAPRKFAEIPGDWQRAGFLWKRRSRSEAVKRAVEK